MFIFENLLFDKNSFEIFPAFALRFPPSGVFRIFLRYFHEKAFVFSQPHFHIDLEVLTAARMIRYDYHLEEFI